MPSFQRLTANGIHFVFEPVSGTAPAGGAFSKICTPNRWLVPNQRLVIGLRATAGCDSTRNSTGRASGNRHLGFDSALLTYRPERISDNTDAPCSS